MTTNFLAILFVNLPSIISNVIPEMLTQKYKIGKLFFHRFHNIAEFFGTKSQFDKKKSQSLNFSNLENFGNCWGENDASWKVFHGYQCCLK